MNDFVNVLMDRIPDLTFMHFGPPDLAVSAACSLAFITLFSKNLNGRGGTAVLLVAVGLTVAAFLENGSGKSYAEVGLSWVSHSIGAS